MEKKEAAEWKRIEELTKEILKKDNVTYIPEGMKGRVIYGVSQYFKRKKVKPRDILDIDINIYIKEKASELTEERIGNAFSKTPMAFEMHRDYGLNVPLISIRGQSTNVRI